MKEEQKLALFDESGWDILETINKKWLKKHLKKHSLVSIEDVWTTEAAVELIDRYLAIEQRQYNWLVSKGRTFDPYDSCFLSTYNYEPMRNLKQLINGGQTLTKKEREAVEHHLSELEQPISIKQYGYLCGQAAARGSFYDRYKAQVAKKKGWILHSMPLYASLTRLY